MNESAAKVPSRSKVRTTLYNEGREMIKNYSADVFLAALVYTNQTTQIEFSQPYFHNWYVSFGTYKSTERLI